MLAFTAPTPDLVNAALFAGDERKTHFQIFDTPAELASFATRHAAGINSSWFGGFPGLMPTDSAIRAFADGDMSGVAKSDALLARFEKQIIETGRNRWTNDVAGACPDVQAFIAGHPLAMRRRQRMTDAAAPLAIIVDIGASGAIEAEAIERRGAAVLALVRHLSASRPVELWAGSILDADNNTNSSATFCRIETSPLDLAHAAFILTNQSAIRRAVWAAACAHGFKGRTPYGASQRHATEPLTRAILAPAFQHVTDLLVLPRLQVGQQSSTNPAAWLESQIATFDPAAA